MAGDQFAVKKKRSKKKRPERRKITVLNLFTPPLPEHYDEVYTIGVVKSGKKVYFCVPWDPPIKQSLLSIKGIKYLDKLDRYAFSYTVLLQLKDPRVVSSSTLRSWMLTITDSTPEEFNTRRRQYAARVVDIEKRWANGTTRGTSFVSEEDAVIKKYYHPGMTADQKYEMLQTCVGRTWKAIRLRAMLLRRKMITAGAYDLAVLPYLNYNVNIQREIEVGKALAEKNAVVIAEEKEV
jgi:hypothetical protein